MSIPLSLEKLVTALARLPGVGQKTAQRLAFALLRDHSGLADQLSTAINEASCNIRFCSRCFSYTEEQLCFICKDPRRNQTSICVVEQPVDIYVIERSRVFNGLYHVLMGSISPLDGIGPDQLKIAELMQRITSPPSQESQISEIILATNPSMNGEATALHIAHLLSQKLANRTGIPPQIPPQNPPQKPLHLTRLARGIPVGGSIEYADDITLNQAFQGRQSLAKQNSENTRENID